MPERCHKEFISIAMIIISLLSIPQAMAWGGLTHYSINKDAGMNLTEELSASVAPDALIDFNYGSNFLDTLVHLEIPNVLYGPLDQYMYTYSESQDHWAAGWMAHTISDRSSHGTYFENSPYPYPDNYLSAAGADTLREHLKAEFGGDILSYWLNQGTIPGEIVIHTDQVRTALSNYDGNCKSDYSQEYDHERFLMAFESLQVVIYAEQLVIDQKQDKEAQLTDKAFLIWAYQKYYEPYKKYYSNSVDNVRVIVAGRPQISQQCRLLSEPEIGDSVSTKIKINVGRELIDNGLIKTNKKFDEKKGTISMNLEQNISGQELAIAYGQYLEKVYEKETGEKLNIQDEIRSKDVFITPKDIKKYYPELYEKLIKKGAINEEVPLIEYILSFFKRYVT
jgi:hypothetical protein